MGKRFFLLFLLTVFCLSAFCQLKRLGFEGKASRIRFYNDTLFASSTAGIRSYDLNKRDGWQDYCFMGDTIRDFMKCGDTIVAATPREILISHDKGVSFTQLDLGGLRPNSNIFLQLIETMEQSNNNPQRMMVVLQSPTREISWLDRTFIGISDDAGETWAWMCPFELRSHQGFERAKLAIDPIDDNHIFIYGKDYRYEGYKTIVMETFDSFQSSFWSYIPYGLYALYWEEYLSNIIFFTSYEEQFSRKIIANNPMNGILCMNDETRQWSYIQSEQYYLFDDIAAIGSTLYGLKLDANVQGGSLNVYESDDCGYSWKFLDSDFAVGSNMDDSWYFKGAEMNLRTAVCQGNIYVYRTEDIYEYTPSLNKITDISNKEKLPDVFYNVGGQKITHPQSGGIYIKNHRKVIKNTK